MEKKIIIFALGILFVIGFLLSEIYITQSLIWIILTLVILLIFLFCWNYLRERDFSSRNIVFWIIVLLITFAIINLPLFYVYQQSHLNDSILVQINGFFGTEIFKLVLASIVFPIILLLIENIFKIRERYEDKVWQRQIEFIKLFQKEFWYKFIDFSDKVIYCDLDKINREKDFKDTIYKYNLLSSSGTYISISWLTYFDHYVDYEDVQIFINLLNYLLNITLSVAYYVQIKHPNSFTLQKSLELIIEQLSFDIHPNIDLLLNNYAMIEFRKPKNKQTRLKNLDEIKSDLKELHADIMDLDKKYNEFLPFFKSKDPSTSKKFSEIKDIADQIIYLKRKMINQKDEKDEKLQKEVEELQRILKEKSYKIDIKTLVEIDRILYSPKFIIKLAKYLSCDHFIIHEIDRITRIRS